METCAEILITKPGKEGSKEGKEPGNDPVVSVVELSKMKKSCETCGLTKEENNKFCLNCGIMV